MNITERIVQSPFYEITSVLDDFARLDYMKRADEINDGSKNKPLPHEECLLNVRSYLIGVTSSFAYMHISIKHIQREHDEQYFLADGYTEYGIYLYHYYVFIHGITTIHDLFFKLVAEICDIRISKHMIQWEELSKLLDEKGEHEIIRQLNEFYKTIKHHEKKRNTASHEGRLTHNLLDRYHITYIWSKVHLGNDVNENIHPEYTEGTNENKYLLGNTKSEFIGELEALIEAAISHTYSLFDLLLPKLIGRMPQEFLNKHRQKFMDLQMQMEIINRVLAYI